MNLPVALIIFNRPDKTERVLASIASARPKQLLVIADGPRADHPEDVERCAATRRVIDTVDWDCTIERHYAERNLGCGHGPADGIDWVFEQVERAVILEDDCVADPSFFPYCEELLERYADDERIVQVSGQSFQLGNRRGEHSYFFSRHNICAGGWATWRRAWRSYDFEIRRWPELRRTNWLRDFLDDERAVQHWGALFDRAHAAKGDADYWDYQWTFACWVQRGVSILPNANLLSNIGFGPDATHTTSTSHKLANLPLEEISFPLSHPTSVEPHDEADRFFVEAAVPTPHRAGLLKRLRWKLGDALRQLLRRN